MRRRRLPAAAGPHGRGVRRRPVRDASDLGRLGPGRPAEVLGRADDVVVTGGEKVPAAVVERVLASTRGVAAGASSGCPTPEWGERVVAVVLPAAGRLRPTSRRCARSRPTRWRRPRAARARRARRAAAAGLRQARPSRAASAPRRDRRLTAPTRRTEPPMTTAAPVARGRPPAHPAGRRRARSLVGTGAAAAVDGFAALGRALLALRRRARAAGRRSTTPTTTATASAAPTPTGSGRCAWSARGSAAPARGEAAPRCCVRGRGRRRAGAGAARPPGGWCSSARPHGGRLGLHRRRAAVRLPRPRRGLGVRLLRPGRRPSGTTYVQAERVTCAGGARRRRLRGAGLRDAGRQQPARHPDRQVAGKRTLAVGSATAGPGCSTWRWSSRRTPSWS